MFFINGIIGGFSLIEILRRFFDKENIVSWFGKHSLFIMATHEPLYITAYVVGITKRLFSWDNLGIQYYMWWFMSLVMLCLVEMILIELLELLKKLFHDKLFRIPIVGEMIKLL